MPSRRSALLEPTFLLHALDVEYRVHVHAPERERPVGPKPVLVCLDADDQFAGMVEAYDELRGAETIPPLLLAGVGYGGSYRDPCNRRLRDYTPEEIPDDPGSGGGEAFVDFLSGKFHDELARRYAVRDDVRGIAGHSLGGLIALHALFRERPIFNRALASAPSLPWAERAILSRVDALRAFHVEPPARVFLGVGERESRSTMDAFARLEARLREEPFGNLRVTATRFPRRNHFNVVPDAWRAGLVALFGGDT